MGESVLWFNYPKTEMQKTLIQVVDKSQERNAYFLLGPDVAIPLLGCALGADEIIRCILIHPAMCPISL